MTDSDQIKETIRATYRARVQGDLDGTMAPFADDVAFTFNGKGTGLPIMAQAVQGKAAVRDLMEQLIASFRFTDWQEVLFVAEADRGALHWRATVTFTTSGRSESFDVFDFYRFRDGKIVDFRQSTDTARIPQMMEA